VASQVAGKGSCYERPLYIRGCHEYKEVWSPTLRDMLHLKVEPTNPQDHSSVAMGKDRKAGSARFCEVTGSSINCGVRNPMYVQVLWVSKFPLTPLS